MIDMITEKTDTAPRKPSVEAPAWRAPAGQEDMAYGQIVIVTARWIFVFAGFLLTLWNPGELWKVQVVLGLVLLLAAANFFLHAQLLMHRPLVQKAAYLTSLADMVVITALVAALGGMSSDMYVFYFPAILAFSVAFRPAVTLALSGSTIVAYGFISLITSNASALDFQTIFARVIMMAAVAVCGSVYWSVESKRRDAALKSRDQLLADLRDRSDLVPANGEHDKLR